MVVIPLFVIHADMSHSKIYTEKNTEIQALRGAAIIFVICHHIGFYHPFIPVTLQWAYTGVDLFFVISGFVVSQAFERDILRSHSVFRRAIPTFYVKRFYRIIPLTVLVTLTWLIGLAFFNESNAFGYVDLKQALYQAFTILTFTQNYLVLQPDYGLCFLSIMWSLCIEEHFYLVYPWIRKLFNNYYIRVTFILVAALTVAFIIRPMAPDQGLNIRFWTHTHCDGIFAGILIAELTKAQWLKSLSDDIKNKWIYRRLTQPLVIFLLYELALLPMSGFSDLPGYHMFTIATALSSILIALASLDNGIFCSGLGFIDKTIHWIGDRSFVIYLFHLPTEALLLELELGKKYRLDEWIKSENGQLVRVLIYTILLIVVSEFIHILVERPFQKLARSNVQLIQEDF